MRKYSPQILTEIGLLLTVSLCLLPDVVTPQGSVVTTNVLENIGPDIPPGGTTLTFVFDVTGSMYDDLQQVIEGARQILSSSLERRDTSPLYNFALVPFHDPEIGPVTRTNDPDTFQAQLQDLYVHGGGDCPEMSIGAIYTALNISLPKSYIYVFTDARAKDYELTNDVLKLVQEKESQVVFVMTGDCGNHSHPGFKAYEQIAATSSGQVFLLNKSDVEEVLRFVKLSVLARKVNLLATDIERGSTDSYRLPIDSRINYVTISLSGDNPRIMLRDPYNPAKILTTDDGLEVLLSLDNVYIVKIPNPKPGIWQLQVSSSAIHTLRVTAVSQLDFSYGFSKMHTLELNETMRRPIKGISNHLLIHSHKLLNPGVFTSVEFLNLRGEVLRSYPLDSYDEHRRLYVIPDVQPPEDFFHIRVVGVDFRNNIFHRLTPSAVSSLIPDAPTVRMVPRTLGYYGRVATLTCQVNSLVPYTLQWLRDGAVLTNEMYYTDSGSQIWDIQDASNKIEGVYACIATNAEGTNRADTFLDITEPPPTIKRPKDVTVFPKGTAILSCLANSTVPYNWTWEKPDSLTARHSRMRQLRNGSLEIVNVQASDAGRYRCIATNEGGPTHAFLSLYVQQVPSISGSTTNTTFRTGQNITLRCSATGYPPPDIRWTKDGRDLPPSPRTLIRDNGQLVILDATKDNEGVYTCTAINSAGMNDIEIIVRYSELPRIEITRKRWLIGLGEIATFPCPAQGNPPPKIMWFKDGMDLSLMSYLEITPNGDLVIMGVQDYDKGEYTCLATNSAGQTSEVVTLEVGSVPSIRSQPVDLGIDYGGNATLTCLAYGHPAPKVAWQRVGDMRLDESRVLVLPNGNLFIQGVTMEDVGSYVCTAENIYGVDRVTAQLKITNLVRPSISYTLESVATSVDSSISLPCDVLMGNPKPTITWYKGSELIALNYDIHVMPNGALTFRSVSMADAGLYRCVARNVAGDHAITVTLTVQIPPTIGTTETRYEVTYRKPITLYCPALGFPVPTIEWLKDGVILSSNDINHYVDDDGSLVLMYTSKTDSGTYTCRVRNLAGSQELDIELHIWVPPEIDGPIITPNLNITINEPVTLPCDVESLPPPTIQWVKDGRGLPTIGYNYKINLSGSLVIQRITRDDAGRYTCVASNVAGNTTRSYTIEVHVPPTILPGPTELTVLAGNAVSLPCMSDGVPEPSVTWQKDGAQLRTNVPGLRQQPGGSLQILAARESDIGSYTCLVSNDAGSNTKTITINVHTPPNITDKTEEYNIVMGSRVILACPASGFPPPTITWTKDAIPISQNNPYYDIDESAGTLMIEIGESLDSGTYECTVSSQAGVTVKQMTLKILVPPSHGEVEEFPLEVTVIVGRSVILPCEVSGLPPPEITWTKNNRGLPRTLNFREHGIGSLEIYRAAIMDSGEYMCTAINVAGNSTKTYRLRVLIPPRIGQGETNVVAHSGEIVTLQCEADGIPLPRVAWQKDSIPVDVEGDPRLNQSPGGSLRIRGVLDADSGDYVCLVSNDAGTDSRYITLTVRVSPIIEESPDEYTVTVRDLITLHCPATGIPDPRILWRKDGDVIPLSNVRYFITTAGSLRISSAIRDDVGMYTCEAENLAGTAYKDIQLIVNDPPVIIQGGDEEYNVLRDEPISLPCYVDSSPPPTITWEKDGHPISPNTPNYFITRHVLQIPRTRVSDSGIFVCIATNDVGSVNHTMRVNVQVAPTIVRGPNIIKAQAGSSTTLPCEAVGVPVPQVMWQKEGRKLQIIDLRMIQTDGGSLIIEDLQERDAGVYTCLVISRAGSDTKRITLEVLKKPQILTNLPETLAAKINSVVVVDCRAIGSPRPEIMWYKDGNRIHQYQNGYTILSNGSLMISSLQPYDNGQYKCMAISEYGNDTVHITIDTQVRPHIVGENSPRNPIIITSTINTQVYMDCNVTDANPRAVIQWFKDGRPVRNRGDTGVQIGRLGTQLWLPDINQADQGVYHCMATNDIGDSSRYFTVSVHVPPMITSKEYEEVTVLAQHRILIRCQAVGSPPPRIMWRYEDIPVSSQNFRYNIHHDGSLEILQVEVYDAGKYTCVAKNIAGNDTRHVDLNVHVRPSINTGSPSMTRITGMAVILPCESAGVPTPTITWEKNGRPFEIVGPNMEQLGTGSLRLTLLTAQDEGHYQCIATNDEGTATHTITLRVNTPPTPDPSNPTNVSTVIDGEVIIPCRMQGNPAPRIRWYKNHHQIRVDYRKYSILPDNSLRILNVKAMDSGTYTCVAHNAAGVKNLDVDMTVKIPPKIDGNSDNSLPTEEGIAIDLECRVTDAFPPPIIEWVKGPELLTGNELGISFSQKKQILHIASVTPDDAGQYQCLVFNAAGNTTKRWDITVLVSPRIPDVPLYDLSIEAMQYDFVTLPCLAEGNPQPWITWEKDGLIITPNDPNRYMNSQGTLEIAQVQHTDSGIYVCHAINPVGNDTRVYTLVINVQPTIQDNLQETIKVGLGQSISINCRAAGFPVPNIKWEKDFQLVATNGLSMRVLPSGALYINSTRIGDSGDYTCIAENLAGYATRIVTLKIQEAPFIPRPPATLTNPNSGEDIRLPCAAIGTPPPEIMWFKNNQLVDHGRASIEPDGTLVIRDSRPIDSGDYMCLATSEAGNFTITLTIQVYAKPEIVQQSVQPLDIVLVLNDPAVLECEVVNAVPPATITWFKDNTLVNAEGSANLQIQRRGEVLFIPKVQVGDSGRYTCFAYNVAGNSTRFYGIDVQVPPIIDGFAPEDGPREPHKIIQTQDDTITLPCQASGSPPPTIVWYKDGYRVTHNSRGVQMSTDRKTLTIRRAETIHQGTYICVAMSSVGNATKTFEVNVQVPPTFESEEPRNVSIILNAATELVCEPQISVPMATITWYKNGRRLQRYETNSVITSDGTTLQIRNSQLGDSGVYMCVARNLVGNASRIFNIEIHIPPVIKDPASVHLTVSNRQPVTLECETYGHPPPEIIWRKDGVFLSPTASARYEMSPTGSLYIDEASVSDTGLYECYVTSIAGNMSKEIVVEVQVPPTIGQVTGETMDTLASQPVRIPCDAVGRPAPSIVWMKGNQQLDESDGITVMESGLLYILNPDTSDSGEYICIARNSAGTAVMKVVLNVQVAPEIEVRRQKYIVTQDESVILKCEATGVPEPEIRWIRNGLQLPGNTAGYNVLSNGDLVIPVVREEDAGMFVCLASNPVNMVQGQRILEVQVPPRIPPAPPGGVSGTVSGAVRLPCPVQGYPVPTVTWHKDGQPISTDSRHSVMDDGTLLIQRVQESDSGLYVCTAYNTVGRSSRELRLTIQVSPRFIAFPNDIELAANDRLELVCEALGVPAPEIQWYINGSAIPSPPTIEGLSELVIHNVRKEDEGTYKCVATNSVGSQIAYASVYIRVPPRIVRPPNGGRVEMAGITMLDCLAEGDPAPQIVWMKNNRLVALNNRVTQAQNGSLIIYGTKVEDTGEYMCKALNAIGETSVTAELRVQSAPLFSVEPEDSVVDEGGIIRLHCVASGEPEPTIRWHKDGFPVSPRGRLTILSNNTLRIVAASLDDSGTYSCYATNNIEAVQISVVIAVRVHGKWSVWGDWDTCSKSCGKGMQRHTRQCNDPQPANDGRQCVGSMHESRECEVAVCPINGRYGEWAEWEECSSSCNRGTRIRTRECNNPPPQYGGNLCQGEASQQVDCNIKPCPIDGSWSDWQDWRHCSTTCGEGEQIRYRRCDDPAPLFNGNDCFGRSRESRMCKLRECPVDGNWAPWASWSTCSMSCAGGKKTRTRTCTNPEPRYGGRTCDGQAKEEDICNLEACPVNGGWSSWEAWTQCSAYCDGGMQKRYRRCSNPRPRNGGRYCVGTAIDTQSCNELPCRRDGGWGSWSDWTSCSATCGKNIQQTKVRECNNPTPVGGGQLCVGNSVIMRSCDVPPCLVGPVQAIASVVGIINGVEFNQTLIGKVVIDEDGYARVNAQLFDVPQEIGYDLRELISLISPIYWTSAYESGNAANGFTITNGLFQRETQVTFPSGEILRMTHSSEGLDQNGILQLSIIVRGEVPEVPHHNTITLQPYTEDYIQIGPGMIYGQSQRMMIINGINVPYAWNHTITYDSQNVRMPFLVQTLRASGITVSYDPHLQIVTFEIGTIVEEGNPSNRCPYGFWLDSTGPYCRDEDECNTGQSQCSHVCINIPGSYYCTCPRGFRMGRDQSTCSDINECVSSGACHHTEDCQNTIGSYICRDKCGAGFQRTIDGANCRDVNECNDQTAKCSHLCYNALGSYRCVCRQGYVLEGHHECTDVDECLQRPCRPNDQNCRNYPGRYECITVCPNGFQISRNNTCEDIDECQRRSACAANQICTNMPGHYSCDCPKGFRKEGSGRLQHCLDINECRTPGTCFHECRNVQGTYECICPEGMIRMPDRHSCVGRPYVPQARDVPPPFCPPGMQNINDRCIDVNECALPDAQLARVCRGICRNTEGSYQCLCPTGYQLARDDITCTDVNECTNGMANCLRDQKCFNTKGGYSCVDVSCPRWYSREPNSDSCIKTCPNNNYQCRLLSDTIKYQTLALPKDLARQIDLIRLVVVKNDNTQHRNSYFNIKDREEAENFCNCRPLPFGIRREDGKGVLFTTKVLDEPKLYRLTVQAQGYTDTNRLEYSTEFVIFISVSAYPY